MMTLTNRILPTPEILQILGMRFRYQRLLLRLTRKEVAEQAGIGMTTLYKFESGNMADISLRTLMRLLRAIGMGDTWNNLIPDLPESPYLYDDKMKRTQRVRHTKSETKS